MNSQDMSLEMYLKEIRRYPLLEPKKELEVIKKIKKGSDAARETLITSNLRLVVNIAKKYVKCGLPLADLIEEGNIGLMYAVERFDIRKKCRFSTYATCWIKHAVCRAITEKNQLVRIPAYMKKIISQYKEVSHNLVKQSGKTPMVQEVIDSTELNRTKKKIVEEALMTNKALEGMQSLQTLHANHEWIEDRRQQEDITTLFNDSEHEWIRGIIENMGAKRAEVIKLRYGLSGKPPMTLKEIASVLALTKERIRQIEKETLSLLRQTLERRSSKNLVTA